MADCSVFGVPEDIYHSVVRCDSLMPDHSTDMSDQVSYDPATPLSLSLWGHVICRGRAGCTFRSCGRFCFSLKSVLISTTMPVSGLPVAAKSHLDFLLQKNDVSSCVTHRVQQSQERIYEKEDTDTASLRLHNYIFTFYSLNMQRQRQSRSVSRTHCTPYPGPKTTTNSNR